MGTRPRGPGRWYKYEVSEIVPLPRGGEIIRSERFRTIRCVAERLSVSETTIKRWIKGETRPGWRCRYIIERIHEPAVEEVSAESVLLTNLDDE